MPPPSDPRNLRAKWQRALEERRKAGAAAPPLDVTPRPARPAAAATGDRDDARPRAAGDRDDARPDPKREEKPIRDAAPERSTPAPGRSAAKTSKPKPSPVAWDPKQSGSPGTPEPSAVAWDPKQSKDAGDRTRARDESDANDRTEAGDKPGAPASKIPGAPKKDDGADAAKKASTTASSPWSSVAAAVILVGGVGFALRTFLGPDGPILGEDPTTDTTTTTAQMEPEPPLEPPRPVVKPRCADLSKQPFVIGDAPAPKPAATSTDSDDPPEDDLAPFAVELGRGIPFGAGFAIGTQREAEGGTVSMVATVGADGQNGKLVRLARSRGDFDAPVVAAAGDAILAAMIEPNAGGRAIRIAKIEGDRVTWGPELSEGRDESLAVDIASTGARALVVWDDVPSGHERSVIDLATFDIGTMRGSGGRAMTPPTIDADLPRLAPRPGGYWLSYLVHGDAPTEPTASKPDSEAPPDDAGPPKKKPSKKPEANPDDSDTEAAGEAIAHQWLELLPLDESGVPTGAPRAVTPKDGRVIGYDLEDGPEGRAVLIYREDDTPNGSIGGRVKSIAVEMGGVGEPHVLAEEGVGTGVPQLLGTWVVIHSMSGPVQIGAIGPRGEIALDLAPEKPLGHGEVLAANGDTFLVATPAGRAMKLGVTRCAR